ncbi:MAG: transglutaminase domain-containing protein [Candidatus Omnitrophota bacterium]|nr:transglutaminase domain-containing protein [Candidatus Omnitrophota bacterium]
MHKRLKFICRLFLIIATVLILLSPVISLFLPYRLRYHAYQRLILNTIVAQETNGYRTDYEKSLSLFNYVVNNEFLQGTPYSCKPLESLIYAEAYCDFQARTLNLLLGIAGIPSRYAMLLDKNGISPHTLNEVFLNNKWCVFDTALNTVFVDFRGDMYSLDDLTAQPELLDEIKKISALKQYSGMEYKDIIAIYRRVLPLMGEPRRSTPILKQSHIFDHLMDFYFKIFGNKFVYIYQNLYIRSALRHLKGSSDSALFYKARNYHLAYRMDLALQSYAALLKEFPESKYYDDVLFFLGKLYYDIKDYQNAIKTLRLVTDKKYGKWDKPASYFLWQSYGIIGDELSSREAYVNVGLEKIPAAGIVKILSNR